MEIQDLKRWHWALIGIIAGLALSFAFSDHDIATDSAWRDKEIKQPDFERAAFSRSHESHEPLLQNVVVEPPVYDYLKHQKQIVRGDRLRYSDKYKQEFRDLFFFYADVPYVPLIKPGSVDPTALKNVKTVMDFLSLARSTLSPAVTPATPEPWQAGISLRYRYGWEYESNWNILLWAFGGAIVVGGIWPTFLNLLIGAGLGKATKPKLSEAEEYLSRFGNGKSDAPKPVVVLDRSDQNNQLDELNAALEAGLTPSSIQRTGARTSEEEPEISAGGSAIRQLDTASEMAINMTASPEEPEETEEQRRKRYAAGDFYPVARGSKKV